MGVVFYKQAIYNPILSSLPPSSGFQKCSGFSVCVLSLYTKKSSNSSMGGNCNSIVTMTASSEQVRERGGGRGGGGKRGDRTCR